MSETSKYLILIEIWGQLIDFKFDSFYKSAFEQVEDAN